MSEHLGEKLILHIPVGSGGFDIDIITMIMSWIVIGLLVALALLFRRSLRQPVDAKPNRIQATLDLLLQFIESQLTSNFASGKLARELFPFIGTLFLFILFSNWISIIPYFESPTKDLNVTFSFALLVFFMSQFYAVRLNGVRRYIKGFMEPYAFLLPLNVIGLVGKPLSHAFRLFGNMFGERSCSPSSIRSRSCRLASRSSSICSMDCSKERFRHLCLPSWRSRTSTRLLRPRHKEEICCKKHSRW